MVSPSATVAAPRPARRFGMPAALGVSILAHVILVLLSLWTPLLDLVRLEPAEPEETLLQFTFAPQRADTEPRTARGEVPFPTEPAQESRELLQPSQEAAGLPQIPRPPAQSAPVPVPVEQVPSPTREEPEDEEKQARPDEQIEDPTPEETTERSERPGADLTPRDRAPVVTGSESDVRDAPKEPAEGLDLSSALRNFQRAIDRSRANRPTEPGGGTRTNVYVPDVSAMPLQGAPYGVLEFSSRDYDWSDYSSQIYWAILKAWYRRLYLTTSDFEKWAHTNQQWLLNHKTRVRFVIERNGDVTGLRMSAESGCPPLDQSAMDALSEVVLPPLPPDFPRDSEEVNATFLANGEIMSMRPMFRYLQQIGYF